MKKITANLVKVGTKVDVKASTNAATAVKAEAPELKRPELPADFCLDKKDWDGNTTCYDSTSNNCKACKKDFADTAKACAERAEFLRVSEKGPKAKKASVSTGSRAGKPTGVKIIDEGILAKLPPAEIIASLAEVHYGDNTEVGIKVATNRFDRHLKALREGNILSCNKIGPKELAYLTEKVAPVIAKAEVAKKKVVVASSERLK